MEIEISVEDYWELVYGARINQQFDASHPGQFFQAPFRIDKDVADETIWVYDHPANF